jgi:Skp family chaperone for outer membrane proteins
VQKQIVDKLNPIYGQVMQRRGANVLVEQGTTLASGSALDVTNDVLAALNAALPTIQTTAPTTTQNRSQGR